VPELIWVACIRPDPRSDGKLRPPLHAPSWRAVWFKEASEAFMDTKSGLFVVLVAIGVSLPNLAHAANFGAIAYSSSTGAYGWSFDYSSRTEAEQVATQNCGEADCTPELWFVDACGAIAIGDDGYGTGWGADRDRAEAEAIETCRNYTMNCSVRQSVCSTHYRG
jgi:serine/threonine-protein kinase